MNQTTLKSDSTFHSLSALEVVTLPVLTVICALAGLPGNVVVLWLLGFCVSRNPISVYILNLATSDFLYLCCLLVFYLWEFSDYFNIAYFKYIHAVGMLLYTTGLFMLSAISVERCLAVLYPIWYRCRRPGYMSAVICALLWAMSLLLTMLLHFSCSSFFSKDELCLIMHSVIGPCLIFVFVILCGSSLTLLVRMLCSSRRLQLTRLYVTLGLTVLVFLLCGLPVGIMQVLGAIRALEIHFSTFIRLERAAFLLSSINSSANPIIYFFVGSFRQKHQQYQQRRSLKLVLQKALEDVAEGEKSGESPPQESVELSGSP
ncbi:mas-related G-protein coupled receptor member X1 [Fukomys damarensis]|uniref:Mas-related G-protein coupled receptor member X1 n=1 Tax=Fukomys damarensis TaxID=885580 RepID=A0A091E3Y0_FUKDA|nr:mas-related G-protein coupled receptor member X1 [Fukomys damarensis]KFO37433.1 Mas-related G-protein coupled receptor member X1 [Fukomys damarensis]